MELLKPFNRLRRKFGEFLIKDYLKNKLEKRKGECKNCGKCCKGCKNLSKDNLCTIYTNRPWFCHKDFPIDKSDLKVWGIKDCGFYFDEDKK